LLNATFNDPTRNATFHQFLADNDLFYQDQELLVFQNETAGLTEFSNEAASATPNDIPLQGEIDDAFYLGSFPGTDLLGNLTVGENFTIVHVEVDTASTDPNLGDKYVWEYYNGTVGGWLTLPVLLDETENFTQSGRIFFNPPFEMQGFNLGTANESWEGTIWTRMRLIGQIGATGPVVGLIKSSVEYVPYYFNFVNVDLFGRPYDEVIPGETDSYTNLLRTMTATNGYAMRIWELLNHRNVNFTEFVNLIGGQFKIYTGPVTGAEIIASTSPVMGIIVYGMLALGVVAASRGRKGTYAISPIRGKKWVDSMTVAPSLKTKEELEKLKLKG
jgi:hypothetical protein